MALARLVLRNKSTMLTLLVALILVILIVPVSEPKHHHHHHHHHHRHHHKHHERHKHERDRSIHRSHHRHESRPANDSWQLIEPAQGKASRHDLFKRQVVDLAVNKLHILESFDGQLIEFAKNISQVNEQTRPDRRGILCYLRLADAFGGEQQLSRSSAESCVDNLKFKSNVPPYVMNLYKQLTYQEPAAAVYNSPAQLLENAIQQMPYKSKIMRAFKQPKKDDHYGSKNKNLVVELNVLAGEHDDELGRPPTGRMDRTETAAYRFGGACNLHERLLPSSERLDLCYWFELDSLIRDKVRPGGQEQLVEAELHLYKLLPEVKSNTALVQLADEPRAAVAAATKNEAAYARNKQIVIAPKRNSNHYHLKTNLLEVSLYQILSKKSHRMPSSEDELPDVGTNSSSLPARLDEEFPLRLLDIRRIDLDSTGWETFYVKGAVEDWLRDESSNLGLVIKAKSMFDEPIKNGLIRFADFYDHRRQLGRDDNDEPEISNNDDYNSNDHYKQHEISRVLEFDSSHQPILVIYTKPTQTTMASR